jgi:hypothetical protein
METKNLSFNGMELPSYLGYGILVPESIRYQTGELYAEYVFECDGSVVHQVKWDKKSCQLETFCHGERGNITICPDLRYALLYDCRTWDLSKDNCYLYFAREILKLGNIYVHLPQHDEKKYSAEFYPAGKMFILWLPLIEKTQKYSDFLRQIKNSEYLRFSGERRVQIKLVDRDPKETIHLITIAEFDAPLAHLFNAAKTIADAGLINKQEIFRLMIGEFFSFENTSIKKFSGDNRNPSGNFIL